MDTGLTPQHQPPPVFSQQKEQLTQVNHHNQQNFISQELVDPTNLIFPNTPHWLSELKNEITVLVTSQFRTLAHQITTNMAKIEFILASLFGKHHA